MSDMDLKKAYRVDGTVIQDLAEVWHAVAPKMDGMLDDFYGTVRSDPELSAFFRDDQHMDHARAKQMAHWKRLFTGGFDSEYLDSARRVGEVHFRIGLPNRYFMSIYANAARTITQVLLGGRGFGRSKTSRLIEPAITAIMMDCDVISAAFAAAESEDRQQALDKLASVIDAFSMGDLSARIGKPYPERFEQNRTAFNTMADRLEGVFQSVAANASGVSDMTREMTRMAEDLSERAQGQAAAVEQSNAAVAELASSLHENNATFKRAIDASENNRKGAESGLSAADRANEAMERIKTGFSDITRITADIEQISFQTNLLALNASVEAARAGEAGKGFAVVASEVSSLAKRAAELTENIRSMVTNSSAVVDEGAVLFDQTKETLSEIMDAAAEVGAQIATVVEAAQAQAMTIDEVKKALDSIDTVTQTNASIAAQVADSCDGLAASADGLAKPFDNFNETVADAEFRQAG